LVYARGKQPTTPKEEPPFKQGAFGKFNPQQPQETEKLEAGSVVEGVVEITIDDYSFHPSEFTVETGQTVSVTFEGKNSATHLIKFEDPRLSQVQLLIGNYKKGIDFMAPEQPGDYVFYCDVSNHRSRGEQGVMHVIKPQQ